MVIPTHNINSRLLITCLLVGAGLALGGCDATTGGGYVATGGGYATGPDYAPLGYDNYVYYPGSGAYYNNTRREWTYEDHDRWVTRSTAPQGWVSSAPSVQMEWHDSPEHHNAEVIRRYPRNWVPAKHQDRDHDHDRKDRDRDDRHHDDDDQH
ncbi:MAG TPA: hypothetical protein VHE61_13470 [Opitutaceae bacterium]|nr:hypothetical protein [Opitutaceae bacterium]